MDSKRITALRAIMKREGIDYYYIPTADFHESEYVGDHFKCRQFLTGFTGSAGIAVVTMKEACLWVDGRYFVQAAKQLKDSGFTLQKMGQEGVPSINEYLQKVMPEGGKLGFDGRVINDQMGAGLQEALEDKHVTISYEEDLVGEIWENRPALSAEPVWILEEKYAGKSATQKIEDLRGEMKKLHADVHVLTTVDDIVWLLNIRGNDVPCNPIVLSYAVVTMDQFYLFINEKTLDEEVKAAILKAADILKEKGAVVENFDLGLVDYAIPAYYVIASAEASSNLSRFDGIKYGYRTKEYAGLHNMYKKTRSEGFGPEVKRRIMLGSFVLSSGYYDAYYLKALRTKALIKKEFDKAFEKYDVILGPAAPSTAPKLGESLSDPLKMYLGDIYTISVNLAGLPGMTVPCGKDSAGLPIGLQLIGDCFQEKKIIRAGYAFEQSRKYEAPAMTKEGR